MRRDFVSLTCQETVRYAGADTRDSSSDFRKAYPGATFRKILARAFVASRVLDFLLSDPAIPGVTIPKINASRVAITGHSRNGKQSLIAAAFDERITAVVGSSPGTPVSAPIRFSSPDFNGETVNFVSPGRDWWLPSVKEYVVLEKSFSCAVRLYYAICVSYFGREDEIPADGHMIIALIAPRHAMIATARSDGEGDVTFAGEQNVLACQAVYSLLEAPNALRVHYREGRHHGFVDPQVYFDWFDFAASVEGTQDLFPAITLPHEFNWDAWRAAQPRVELPMQSAPLQDRIAWLLGGKDVASAISPGAVGKTVFGAAYCESGPVGSEWDYKAALMMHDSFKTCSLPNCTHPMTRQSLSVGAFVTSSLFLPCSDLTCKEITKPLPVIIFIHGFAYQLGFTGIYGLYVLSLIDAGFAWFRND